MLFPVLSAALAGLLLVLSPLSSAAADVDDERLQRELISPWIVTIDGEARVRAMHVRGAQKRADNAWALDATYGWPSTEKPSSVKADLSLEAGRYKLELVTQANSRIVAESADLKVFVGTFTPAKGDSKRVTVERVSADEFTKYRAAASQVVLQTGSDSSSALVLRIGDRWVWSVEDKTSPRMIEKGCSSGFPKGAQEIETVTGITDQGYVTEVLGPMPGWRDSRTYMKDGSYRAVSDGKEIRAGAIRFPVSPGRSWDAVLGGERVVTTLKCEAKSAERMSIGNEDLEVIPVVCEGRWRSGGNSDTAEYKYWYSPVVGRSVRHTGLTYAWGGTCFNAEWRLENYTKNK